MNLDNIRKLIHKELGVFHNFVYKGLRGQDDFFSGKIVKLYSHIFIIKTNDNVIKTFSYNDYAIKNLKIY